MLSDLEERQLDVIQTTYPGWRITFKAGRWWAIKRTPPTEEQKQIGVHAMIGRDNALDLVAALGQQLMTMSQHRLY